jgi:hypothetical protein
VENKVDRLVVLCVSLLLHVLLVLLEQLRAELDVAWFVHSMDLYAVSVCHMLLYTRFPTLPKPAAIPGYVNMTH